MNPKVLIVVLFLVTFTISFAIYMLVVNVINPHIDLSNTAKNSIEIAPQLDETMFGKNKNQKGLNVPANLDDQNISTYESDLGALMEEETASVETQEDLIDDTQSSVLDDTEHASILAPGEPVIQPDKKNRNSENTLTEEQENKTSTSESSYTVSTVESNTEFVPDADLKQNNKDEKKEQPKPEKLSEIQKVAPTSINRVVVGSYSSIDDAKQAYDKMLDSNMNVAPIIKEKQGRYTLQVGAFSDKKRAETLVDELNNKNYAAKIVPE
jgi:cell division septation protein DedD